MKGEYVPFQPHSDESRDAADSIRPHCEALEVAVLKAHMLCWTTGATDKEIERLTGLDGSTVRPRRISLLEKGLVRRTVTTRRNPSGRRAGVYCITTAGLEYIKNSPVSE